MDRASLYLRMEVFSTLVTFPYDTKLSTFAESVTFGKYWWIFSFFVIAGVLAAWSLIESFGKQMVMLKVVVKLWDFLPRNTPLRWVIRELAMVKWSVIIGVVMLLARLLCGIAKLGILHSCSIFYSFFIKWTRWKSSW